MSNLSPGRACPPPGSGAHHYTFTLIATDLPADLPPGLTREELFTKLKGHALAATGLPFAYVNVLEDPEIFDNLPRYADWPTFPQIYINGELIGGCDITLELYQSGELQKLVVAAVKPANA